jgi:hypothetical protein
LPLVPGIAPLWGDTGWVLLEILVIGNFSIWLLAGSKKIPAS